MKTTRGTRRLFDLIFLHDFWPEPLAWAYVEQRFARERSAQIRCPGDMIRRHRDDHAAAWLRAAVEQGIQTGDIESVLDRFLRRTG